MGKAELQSDLLTLLQAAVGGLELPSNHSLRQDLAALSSGPLDQFRIAVFAPFNYGKSTLLNALLGERILPMDLIPTTGTAISVQYGAERHTQISFVNGETISAQGIDLLQDYAILDGERRMRADVAAVKVFCPHPWLQTGVEFLDLPGTDDQEAQDTLVRERLLTADLIVQVLDGRKLMTLGEREHLRDWLQDRGVETVVFVVNFLNLLEPEDQKQVTQRMRFVAESFRAQLPLGVSNLYRVDALPALRARLQGDFAAAQATGLPSLESALAAIIQTQQQQGCQPKLARLKAVASKVRPALAEKLAQIQTEIETRLHQQQQEQLKQQQRQQTQLRDGLKASLSNLRQWLAPAQLQQQYGQNLARVLEMGDFQFWWLSEFQPDWEVHQQEVFARIQELSDWAQMPLPSSACLQVVFPAEPILQFPESGSGLRSDNDTETATVAIASGLGLVIGGPVGAAVLGGASYLLNRAAQSSPGQPQPTATPTQLEQISNQAAIAYLNQVSQVALQAVTTYEQTIQPLLNAPLPALSRVENPLPQHHQVRFLEATLAGLEDCMEEINEGSG